MVGQPSHHVSASLPLNQPDAPVPLALRPLAASAPPPGAARVAAAAAACICGARSRWHVEMEGTMPMCRWQAPRRGARCGAQVAGGGDSPRRGARVATMWREEDAHLRPRTVCTR
ncbi:unnamed protein product [Urochloa humidicola]